MNGSCHLRSTIRSSFKPVALHALPDCLTRVSLSMKRAVLPTKRAQFYGTATMRRLPTISSLSFIFSLHIYLSFAGESLKFRESPHHYHDIFYGLAMMGRLPEFLGLFCKRALQNHGSFAKESWIFRDSPHHYHDIFHGVATKSLLPKF